MLATSGIAADFASMSMASKFDVNKRTPFDREKFAMYCIGQTKCYVSEEPLSSLAGLPKVVLFWLVVLASVLSAGKSPAVTLDEVIEQSMLGEPLRIVVAVGARPDETITRECFRVVPSAAGRDGAVPGLDVARVDLEHIGGRSRLVVANQRSVSELAMRVTIQASCETPITREYVILFDPPVADGSQLATATNARSSLSAAIEASSTSRVPDTLHAASEAPVELVPPSHSAIRNNEPARARRAPEKKRAAQGGDSRPSSSGVRRKSAPNEVPRLEISRAQPRGRDGLDLKTNFDARSQREKQAALDEHEAILRQRVSHLALQVERMQEERIAELTAVVAQLQADLHALEARERAAAQAAATRTPQGKVGRWVDEYWPSLISLSILAALGAGVFAWKVSRIRRYSLPIGESPIMASAQDMNGPNTEGADSLVVGPYMTSPRVAHTEAGAAKSRAREPDPPGDVLDAEFDHDIKART
jgi:hypothetical protein